MTKALVKMPQGLVLKGRAGPWNLHFTRLVREI